jgi:hypothetical protein
MVILERIIFETGFQGSLGEGYRVDREVTRLSPLPKKSSLICRSVGMQLAHTSTADPLALSALELPAPML